VSACVDALLASPKTFACSKASTLSSTLGLSIYGFAKNSCESSDVYDTALYKSNCLINSLVLLRSQSNIVHQDSVYAWASGYSDWGAAGHPSTAGAL
jgi:hypothetical protein